jgi:hypothetical protein
MNYTITFGGWYQRTTLHLTEIYDFLANGVSWLDLSKEKLEKLHKSLRITEVTREAGYLEFVSAKTSDGINIKYYEDGLYILEHVSDDIEKSQNILSDYFEKIFEPAILYIFSLGAPTPKVLANIKIIHPTVVSSTEDKLDDYLVEENKYGKVYSKLQTGKATVYKTPGYIFVISPEESFLSALVETQIFFREFKDQLQKYLNIHRNVWEEIADIKEKGEVKGEEVGVIRSKLDSYQKTINLIRNRINQMGTYINTRRSIAGQLEVESELIKMFQYKFETLSDTLGYIKELWRMTMDYLNSAIQIIVEIENKSTNVSIRSLRIITTVGVISGILGYMAREKLPKLTGVGVIYLVGLLIATWAINWIIMKAYKRRKYKLRFTEREKDI